MQKQKQNIEYRNYNPIYIDCAFNGTILYNYITLSENLKNIQSNSIYRVKQIQRKWDPFDLPKIVWCISPLFGSNKLNYFVESVEFHRILGVSHAIAYNYSAQRDSSIVLSYYESKGFLSVVPFRSSDADHMEVQEISFLDCLLRTMGTYRFMMNTDIDEIIVPRSLINFTTLIIQLLKKNVAGEYRFLHVHFMTDKGFLSEFHKNYSLSSDRKSVV